MESKGSHFFPSPAFGRHPGRGEDVRVEVHKPLRESRRRGIVICSGALSSVINEKAREQRQVGGCVCFRVEFTPGSGQVWALEEFPS